MLRIAVEEFSEYLTDSKLYLSRSENFFDSFMVFLYVLCMTLDWLFETSFWTNVSYILLLVVMIAVLIKYLVRFESYSFIVDMSI